MPRRHRTLAALTMALALVLAACGGDDDGGDQQAQTGPRTLTVWLMEGSTPPDVMELGNTLVSKYGAAGALQDLSGNHSQFENSQSWLQSLTESCTVDGKLVCAPYLAGSRAVIYRKSMFAKDGITATPTSMDELKAASDKLMSTFGSDKRFSALYFPGKYWYAA